jgi:hypothetical protein
MLDQVINTIIELRMFIVVSAVATIVMGVALLIICRTFSFDGKNIKIVCFFYRMKMRDTLVLATGLAKICLCISFFFSGGKVTNGHIAIYVILHLIYMIHGASVNKLPGDIFNGIATCTVMVIMGMLYNYLRDVMYDQRIQAVVMLMMIVVSGYAICDLLNSCASIIRIPKVKEKKNES